MTTRLFKWLVAALVLIAVFAAGQLFCVFLHPKLILIVCLAALLMLLLGYWFGVSKRHNPRNTNNN